MQKSTLESDKQRLPAYSFDAGGGGEYIDVRSEDNIWPNHPSVLWLHLDYSDQHAVDWLNTSSGLDPLVIEALLAEETRPRTTTVGDGLLIALRGVNLTPGTTPDDMVAIRIWLRGNRIITTNRRQLLSVNDLLEQLKAGHGPRNATEFVVELADRLIWRMNDTIGQFEDRVAELEERIIEGNGAALRYELATLRRQAITLRRYLAPERDALSHLIAEKIAWLDNDNRFRLREINDRLQRYIEDLDAVRERAAVTQEEVLSRLSEQMNNRIYLLSIVAALFLPLGFLTGLLGVNLGGIPGSAYPMAFWIFLGLLSGLIALQIGIFRWKNWL